MNAQTQTSSSGGDADRLRDGEVAVNADLWEKTLAAAEAVLAENTRLAGDLTAVIAEKNRLTERNEELALQVTEAQRRLETAKGEFADELADLRRLVKDDADKAILAANERAEVALQAAKAREEAADKAITDAQASVDAIKRHAADALARSRAADAETLRAKEDALEGAFSERMAALEGLYQDRVNQLEAETLQAQQDVLAEGAALRRRFLRHADLLKAFLVSAKVRRQTEEARMQARVREYTLELRLEVAHVAAERDGLREALRHIQGFDPKVIAELKEALRGSSSMDATLFDHLDVILDGVRSAGGSARAASLEAQAARKAIEVVGAHAGPAAEMDVDALASAIATRVLAEMPAPVLPESLTMDKATHVARTSANDAVAQIAELLPSVSRDIIEGIVLAVKQIVEPYLHQLNVLSERLEEISKPREEVTPLLGHMYGDIQAMKALLDPKGKMRGRERLHLYRPQTAREGLSMTEMLERANQNGKEVFVTSGLLNLLAGTYAYSREHLSRLAHEEIQNLLWDAIEGGAVSVEDTTPYAPVELAIYRASSEASRELVTH
ncbi:MAG: hypothetical protein COY40_00800 [Alphaproteobacteria bacterium CG_4_10_14_0_8_um_filter_53_9]|nr:MAG: hypothetical protein COY40_00800 [Alphaproteobacteria bacterium CG_4_10_14_0_8_um_filter_53_9]